MGQLAVQRLLYRTHKPEATPIHVEIASKLIVRQSVAPYQQAVV
jgi:DNA-binding LacI/PurR family transcriptional regulator